MKFLTLTAVSMFLLSALAVADEPNKKDTRELIRPFPSLEFPFRRVANIRRPPSRWPMRWA
jgi:hypothetical protein